MCSLPPTVLGSTSRGRFSAKWRALSCDTSGYTRGRNSATASSRGSRKLMPAPLSIAGRNLRHSRPLLNNGYTSMKRYTSHHCVQPSGTDYSLLERIDVEIPDEYRSVVTN